MEPFIERLDTLMRERGIDQSELARRSGFDQTTISRWLTRGQGHRQPKPESIARVAQALEVDAAWEFIEYRRWKLHRSLDEWIDRDEEMVEVLLARLAPAQGQPE